jgi:hypothetical protein
VSFVEDIKAILSSFLPHLQWREESELLSARDAIDSLEPDSANSAESTSSRVSAGVKNADGSDKTPAKTTDK